jgi:hypothetical protein
MNTSLPTRILSIDGQPRTFVGLGDVYFNALYDEFEPEFIRFCKKHLKRDY